MEVWFFRETLPNVLLLILPKLKWSRYGTSHFKCMKLLLTSIFNVVEFNHVTLCNFLIQRLSFVNTWKFFSMRRMNGIPFPQDLNWTGCALVKVVSVCQLYVKHSK